MGEDTIFFGGDWTFADVEGWARSFGGIFLYHKSPITHNEYAGSHTPTRSYHADYVVDGTHAFFSGCPWGYTDLAGLLGDECGVYGGDPHERVGSLYEQIIIWLYIQKNSTILSSCLCRHR